MIHPIRRTLFALSIAAASASAVAAGAPASGSVTIDGSQWAIADAIAYVDGDTLKVAVSNKAFDLKAFGKDSKIDDFDLMMHTSGDVAAFTIQIAEDGSFSGYSKASAHGGGGGFSSDIEKGFTLKSRSAERVAGTLKFAGDDELRADISFDLPITTRLERAGQKLPAGGGDIGKAVLAHFAAMATGDKEKILATAPPDVRAEQRKAMEDPSAKEMLAFLAETTPTQVQVTGGVVDGDSAVLDFTGVSGGEKVRGTIDGTRIDGRWYFNNTSTSSGSE